MRRTYGWTIVAVGLSLAASTPGRANAQERAAASGFLLQGTLAAATAMAGGFEEAFFMSGFGLTGSLRVGGMFDAAAVAVDVSYASGSDDNSYAGQVRVGPTAEIFLWRSLDGAARVYALTGVDFGAFITRQDSSDPYYPSHDDETFTAGLKLGFGGCYFLHPNFTLGMELGADTTFIGTDDTHITSSFFAALAIGFVAGS